MWIFFLCFAFGSNHHIFYTLSFWIYNSKNVWFYLSRWRIMKSWTALIKLLYVLLPARHWEDDQITGCCNLSLCVWRKPKVKAKTNSRAGGWASRWKPKDKKSRTFSIFNHWNLCHSLFILPMQSILKPLKIFHELSNSSAFFVSAEMPGKTQQFSSDESKKLNNTRG